jgi:hypothetical protein
MNTSFGNEFFRAVVAPVKSDSELFQVEFFSKDNLIFTEILGDEILAIETAQAFVKQREKLHGK